MEEGHHFNSDRDRRKKPPDSLRNFKFVLALRILKDYTRFSNTNNKLHNRTESSRGETHLSEIIIELSRYPSTAVRQNEKLKNSAFLL